jgi:hypothetical protein
MDKWLNEYVEKIMETQVVKNGIFDKSERGFIRGLTGFFRHGRTKEGQSSVSATGTVLHECSN